VVDGKVQILDTPALSAINARLCDDFIDDCEKVMLRWNRVFQTHNLDYSLKLPHRAFHRAVGEFADVHATADGELVSETEWQDRKDEWVASDSDLEYILSLMQQETRPGKFADWIAAPRAGINGQPGDFEYVRVVA
jgi:benzoyl-CoA 2,3-dioxygenase component B